MKRFQKFGTYHPQLSKAKLPIANCQLPVDKTLQLCAGGTKGIKTTTNHFLTDYFFTRILFWQNDKSLEPIDPGESKKLSVVYHQDFSIFPELH